MIQYLSTARKTKGSKFGGIQEEAVESILQQHSSDQSIILDKFALPILIVGWKPSTINMNDLGNIKKLRETIGKIRSIALEIGASFSLHHDSNKQLLKRYFLHRLYPEQIPLEASIEVCRSRIQEINAVC